MADLGAPGSQPLNAISGFGDHTAGICAALVRQRQTGKGDKVSVSLYHSVIWNSGSVITGTYYGEDYPKPRTRPLSPLTHTYRCKDDRWVVILILEHERHWPVFCKTLGREDLISDPRFNTRQKAKENAENLIAILDEVIATKDREEWAKLWTEVDIAFERVKHFGEILEDEQAWSNNYLTEISFANGKKAILPTSPVQFSEVGKIKYGRAHLLGEHTNQVLEELGFNTEQMQEMQSKRVIK